MTHADLAAERALLGGALMDPGNAAQAAALLVPADFTREAHRAIFGALLRLHEQGRPADLVTLAAELERAGQLEAAGGPTALAALLDGLPRVMSLESWARAIREHSRARALRTRLDRMRAQLDEGDAAADEVLAELERLSIPGSLGGGILDRREVSRLTWSLIDEEVSGKAAGISTGFPSLDDRLRCRGWRPGQLVYIGARTSRGKSALLIAFAEAAAAAGHRVLMFSLEMTPEEVGVRRLVSAAAISTRAMFAWGRSERERALSRLTAAAAILERPFDFAAPSVRSLAGVRAECLRARAQGGLGLVVVDYLGLVRHESSGKRDERSLYERTTLVSQALKALSMELEVPVLAAVQLNREPASRDRRGGSARPTLAHFRDSGAIEQDCDIALLIHQRESTGAIQDGRVELLVEKQRNGWTGAVGLRWDATVARFEEPEGEP